MLFDLILKHNVKTLTVVGMAKNVGKTVVFNHLAAEAATRGIKLGLTSVGRDGEKRDAVFGVPKPGIHVPAGAIVATALACLKDAEAEVETLRQTGFHTALGEVILGRVRRAGLMELAGPTLVREDKEIIRAMRELGAEMVLIDGALDRMSAAAPSLTEGVVLSTGAALGSAMRDVLDRTGERIERFSLPRVEDPRLLALWFETIERAKAAVVDGDYKARILQVEGSLTAGAPVAAALTPAARWVVLTGAVGDDVLRHLTGVGKIGLVVRNGACLFCGRRVWREFIARGGRIEVIEPIRLLAVTLNPTSATGPGFDPEAFLELAGEAFAPMPVVDVVLGKGYHF